MKKKIILILTFVFLSASVFAQMLNQNVHVINLKLEDLEACIEQIDSGEVYILNLEGDISPEDVTSGMIFSLHYFHMLNSENKLYGPIEYIYFGGVQSKKVFYDLRQKIEASSKFVCVDIGESRYNYDEDGFAMPVPNNCFANHDNIYWVYFGSFDNKEVPSGCCANLKNLKSVFMWDVKKIEDTAFKNVNPDATIVDYNGESLLSDVLAWNNKEKNEDWDYLTFTKEDKLYSVETYNFNKPDNIDISDFYYDSMLDYYYANTMSEINFGNSGAVEICTDNLDSVIEEDLYIDDRNSVARKFLALYLAKDDRWKEFVVPGTEFDFLEQSFNPKFNSIFDLSGNISVFPFPDGTGGTSESFDVVDEDCSRTILFGIKGTAATQEINDLGIIEVTKRNDRWYVSQFQTFVLMSFMINNLY